MNHLFSRNVVALVVLLMCFKVLSAAVFAKSAVKLQKLTGEVDITTEGTAPFSLKGTASHLGRFTAYGEVDFLPGAELDTLVGEGVVVFEAANGDLLVGTAIWLLGAETADGRRSTTIHFSWRDAVEFSDGTIVANTGRFVDDRPPGLVVVAIYHVILRLIGFA
jgi:ABC-type transport system substrate-binding protein